MRSYGEKHIQWFAIDFEAIEYNKNLNRGVKLNKQPRKKTEIWEAESKEQAEYQVEVMKKLYHEDYNIVVAFRYVEAYTILD